MAPAQPLSLAPLLATVQHLVRHIEEESRQTQRFTAPDFTPFHFIAAGEVPTTFLLAFLLSAHQTHGQGLLFQNLLITQLRRVPQVGPRLPKGVEWTVATEKSCGAAGRLDLLLTAPGYPGFGICIENKPRDQTGDQPSQLTRYHDYLRACYGEQFLLLYLSRIPRSPSVDSITPDLLEKLADDGQYANITYQQFLLPLLDRWRRAAKPQHLRRFIRQFSHHLEQYLNLPSTKPTSLVQDAAIAAELQATPATVGAAFDIAAALPTLRRNLLAQLMRVLSAPAPGLEGRLHWAWGGFEEGTDGNPLLIRRVDDRLSSSPANWPWGRYAIAIEFLNGQLYCLLRYDVQHWCPADLSENHCTHEESMLPATILGTKLEVEEDWWLWWAEALPESASGSRDENLRTVCVAIADPASQLLPNLLTHIQWLARGLDMFCGSQQSN